MSDRKLAIKNFKEYQAGEFIPVRVKNSLDQYINCLKKDKENIWKKKGKNDLEEILIAFEQAIIEKDNGHVEQYKLCALLEAYEKADRQNIPKEHIMFTNLALYGYSYYQNTFLGYKKIQETSIFYIDETVFESFKEELPDGLTFKELDQYKDMFPAIFLYKDYIVKIFKEEDKCVILTCGERIEYTTLILEDKDLNKIFNQDYKNGELFRTIFNLAVFLNSKDVSKEIEVEELNRERFLFEQKMEDKRTGGLNVSKDEKILKKIPSYKMINLEKTLKKYNENYYKANNIDLEEKKYIKITWRRAHWHSYWIGKRESIERKLIRHRIPNIPIRIKTDKEELPKNIYKIKV